MRFLPSKRGLSPENVVVEPAADPDLQDEPASPGEFAILDEHAAPTEAGEVVEDIVAPLPADLVTRANGASDSAASGALGSRVKQTSLERCLALRLVYGKGPA